MIYESAEDKVFIRFKRQVKNKTEEVGFDKKPILLQLNPENPNNIIRVHFKGSFPAWIKDYAAKNGYSYADINTKVGKGFSLTKTEKRFIICPFIKGQINEWFEALDDDSYADFYETLIAELEIVEKNLKYYAEEFKKYGLYHRHEEIEGKYSSMALKPTLLDTDDFNALAESAKENWRSLIQSLITPRDYPLEEEDTAEDIIIELDDPSKEMVEVVLDESTEEEVKVVLDESAEEEVNIVLDDSTEEEVNIVLDDSTKEEVNIVLDKPSEEVVQFVLDESAEEEIKVVIDEPSEEKVPTNKEITTEEKVMIVENEPVQLSPLRVATHNSKKDGVVEGQSFLF